MKIARTKYRPSAGSLSAFTLGFLNLVDSFDTILFTYPRASQPNRVNFVAAGSFDTIRVDGARRTAPFDSRVTPPVINLEKGGGCVNKFSFSYSLISVFVAAMSNSKFAT